MVLLSKSIGRRGFYVIFGNRLLHRLWVPKLSDSESCLSNFNEKVGCLAKFMDESASQGEI